MFISELPNRGTHSTPVLAIASNSFDQFQTQIQQEFITGSAIHPDLFTTTIRIVSDTEVLPGGDVTYPIHEALNWRVSRFGQQARTTFHAALFQNADGSTWQAKLSQPVLDKQKDKLRKYETPVGNGSRAYFPEIPTRIRSLIGQRYGVEVPATGDFWDWLADQPHIPILYTEGGKKALSLLSLGYVAIALYGVNGGYRTKDGLGESCDPYLIDDLQRFTVPHRPTILAFDQDAKPETAFRVSHALSRFGHLLAGAGAAVSVAIWDGSLGKGVDDLIVNAGADVFDTAYTSAIPLDHWHIHQRLIKRLTYAPARLVETADLTTLAWNHLPESGIIAIASAKGTAKTKTIGQIVAPEPIVALSTFRICLGRNLCQRIGIHWRGDLDKVEGKFITGDGYTLRVGFCVDSLLAIDPEQFKGCVLVIDEAVQVFRHLLTSSTCRKDGRLPALLARLRDLIQAARRIIVADADLDNATLNYLADLRGDGKPVYLIHNRYKPEGYAVAFIQASDPSPAIARLLQSITAGSNVFVTTDSKAASKRLALQLERLGASVLLINADTSGGELEQQFIINPDAFLAAHCYQAVIATPSLSTGVSIESSHFDQVYGLFYGVSSTDADMAQGLSRVRPPVPRTVWCAPIGRNLSPVSSSTNALHLKAELKTRTDWTAALLRAALHDNMTQAIASYDWQSNPHLNLWARISADANFSMVHLRAALLVRLRWEGNQVTVEDLAANAVVNSQIKAAKDEIKQMEAVAIATARVLTRVEQLLLESNESLSPTDQLNLAKTHIADFYSLGNAAITPELVLADRGGRRRAELLALEAQWYATVADQRDIRGLERQVAWNQGICPWDLGTATIRRHARQQLGLDAFLDPEREWTRYDLEAIAQKARANKTQIKLVLNFTISEAIADTQIVHQLLGQMGVRIIYRWSRSVPGHEGEKLRVYRLDPGIWAEMMAILERRSAQRRTDEAIARPGSPIPLDRSSDREGDPADPNSLSLARPDADGFYPADQEASERGGP